MSDDRIGRDDVDAGIEAELRFHLEERIEALEAEGLTPGQARTRALEEFGDVDAVRRGLVEIDRRIDRRRRRREGWFVFLQEWRHAFRRLRRSPGFAAATITTLALGIGVTTAVFAMLDGVVLKALPYPSASRLVRLNNAVPGIGGPSWGWARGQFLFVQPQARTFDAMGLYRIGSSTVMRGGGEAADYGNVASVSSSLQEVLGAGVVMGRPISNEENLAGAAPVVLLTHDYWERHRQFDAGVIGSVLELDGVAHEVVGVLSKDARLPEEVAFGESFNVDLWVPMRLDPADTARNHHVFRAIGRLADGASMEGAIAEMSLFNARLPDELPSAYSERFMRESGFAPELTPLHDVITGGSKRALWILFGAVGLVLAITCANVANLFLVRLDARRREVAVRSVIGASRLHLARQFLAESLALTAIAGGTGLLMAAGAVSLTRQAAPVGMPRVSELAIGWRTAAFAFAVSLIIGILFGVLPVLRGQRGAQVLRESGRGMTSSRRRLAVRHALIAAQIGLCFVLLVGAGLLVRSFNALSNVEPGFEPEGVLTFRVVLPAAVYGDYETAGAFYRTLSEQLLAMPAVTSVGLVESLPLGGDDGCTSISVDVPGSGGACIRVTESGPGYFETAGIPVRGRDATWAEITSGDRVAIVSEALARRMWPGEDPMGRGVRAGATQEWHRVIGVAGDVSESGLADPASELLYIPVLPAQAGSPPSRNMAVLIRTASTDPLALLPSIRATLAAVDPRVPLTRPRPMTDIVVRSMARLTFLATLLAIAALMALAIGAVGIYGVVSYAVAQRRGEIGVRMALGAQASQVRSLVVRQSVFTALGGVIAGLLVALPLAGALRSYLYGVSETDPLTLTIVGGFLLLLAAAASHLPARRAVRVNPVEALRAE